MFSNLIYYYHLFIFKFLIVILQMSDILECIYLKFIILFVNPESFIGLALPINGIHRRGTM